MNLKNDLPIDGATRVLFQDVYPANE